jgi:NAD(P)-dependent dehydrogenase (short-subunit alcohol dehydrogenase family)
MQEATTLFFFFFIPSPPRLSRIARFPAECTNKSYAKEMFDINYFGAVDLTHHLLPLVRQSKGRVLFVSSVAAYGWHFGSAIYSSMRGERRDERDWIF